MRRRSKAAAEVTLDDGFLNCRFASEAELRSGIARIADAYGWIVEEEVEVRGWGRIDLVLRSAPLARPVLVELKVELLKASDVRRAYQQVDGYSRWWAKEKSEANLPVLCANKIDRTLIKSVGDAYTTVSFRTAFEILAVLRISEVTPFRVACADRRLAERRHEFDVNDAAVRLLTSDREDAERRRAAIQQRDAAAECVATLRAADFDVEVDR